MSDASLNQNLEVTAGTYSQNPKCAALLKAPQQLLWFDMSVFGVRLDLPYPDFWIFLQNPALATFSV